MQVDKFKLNHWTNARKLTPKLLAERAGVAVKDVEAMLSGEEAPNETVASVAEALQVSLAQLDKPDHPGLAAVWQRARDLYASRRPIQRDGIHFYNYYSMAAPPGRVAPVILDILCPEGRVPALNNGHLEPAITVNLGPGDIWGRWGEELTQDTWQTIAASPDSWIVGESYVEPAYCPHSYSLATSRPARIVSYTGHSNLGGLIEEVNTWGRPATDQFAGILEPGLSPETVADVLLGARGHDRASAAEAAGIKESELTQVLADPLADVDLLQSTCTTLGLDYRLILPAGRRHDKVGKTYQSLDDTRRSIREFRGYTVASMASAPHLPDLVGLFVKIHGNSGESLAEPNETHYLVIEGEVTLQWLDADGRTQAQAGGPDDSAWVGPYVSHRWSGNGSVLKLSSGPHVALSDLLELTHTYEPAATIRRGCQDLSGWGYDS